jgi:hypothetical protein
MKNIIVTSLAILTLSTALHAAGPAAPAGPPAPEATQSSVLKSRIGQQVELRLKSGEKISGKLISVGAHLVHLTALTGMEFFEATVTLDDISAVVVRSAGK